MEGDSADQQHGWLEEISGMAWSHEFYPFVTHLLRPYTFLLLLLGLALGNL
jgi:hypothetical protein